MIFCYYPIKYATQSERILQLKEKD